MGRLLVLLAILTIKTSLTCGQQREADSLVHALDAAGSTEGAVDILNSLAFYYYDFDSPRAFDYASRAADLARDLGYLKGLRTALTLSGFYYSTIGQYDSAIASYRRSADVDIPDDEALAYNAVLTGNAFRALSLFDSAELQYHKALNLLETLDAPAQQAYAYRNLAELYILWWKNNEAEKILRKSLAIYDSIGRINGIAEAWFLMAQLKIKQADYGAAENCVEKGCALASALNQDFMRMRCLTVRGEIALEFGELTPALKNLFEALGVLKNSDNVLLAAALYTDIGDVYSVLEQPQMALRYYSRALETTRKIGARREEAILLGRIAGIVSGSGDFARAKEMIETALKIQEDIGDDAGMSYTYIARGRALYAQEEFLQALEAFEGALRLREKVGHREGQASCYLNMSLVYLAMNEVPTALSYQQKGLAIEESIGHKHNSAYSHNRLGSLYTRLKDYRRASDHLTQAAAIASGLNSKSLLMRNNLYWAAYFEARGNEERAYHHFKRYAALRDSIHNDIDAQKLAELQALYVMEKKDQEIRLLTQDRLLDEQQIDLQKAQINRQRTIIGSVVLILLLLSLLMYKTWQYSARMEKAHREISEQKEEIETQSEELREANEEIARINKALEDKIGERTEELSQAYKELDTFFYRASHDFRRPLTTFMGLAEVAKVTVRDTSALELFAKVRETASNLDKMLIKLQSISDMGSQQLAMKEVRLKEIFDTVCDNYRDDLERKRIVASADISVKGPFFSYPALVRIIIENLVENAVHFSGVEKPYIRLMARESAGFVTLEVKDNGQGISPEYQPHVFDMYFRANERSKGNGLGLYIVRKAVEKLDGSITLSSVAQSGSTFTVMLPNENGHK